MIDIPYTLSRKYPETYWELNGDLYEGLVWREDNIIPKPTLKELTAKYNEAKAEDEAVKYRLLRAENYPPIGDQVGAMLKHLEALGNLHPELQEIVNKVAQVKRDYPKPGDG